MSMNILHDLHSQPGKHGAICASVDNRYTLLCAVCPPETSAELPGPGKVTGIFLPAFERMKIHAEELFCLGLALESVFGCPTEVEEEWSLVGNPPADAPLRLIFPEPGASSYLEQSRGFTPFR